ncbi:MAG TPA: hypothetical protein EYQ50_14430 [Verrucomicrobiales bacterium]|nr:hypothetical protein [Verrucomicrobiales bacterium]
MKHTNFSGSFCVFLSFFYCCFFDVKSTEAANDQSIKGSKAMVYRDQWGVPHIYADTREAGIYALGYCQAQDRLEDIYKAVRTGVGSNAEVFGAEHVQMDYMVRLFRNTELAEAAWERPHRNCASSVRVSCEE